MRPEKLVGFLYKTATKVAVKAALGSGAEVERAAFPLQQKSALPRPWMLVAPATFPIKLFTLTSLFAAFKLQESIQGKLFSLESRLTAQNPPTGFRVDCHL